MGAIAFIYWEDGLIFRWRCSAGNPDSGAAAVLFIYLLFLLFLLCFFYWLCECVRGYRGAPWHYLRKDYYLHWMFGSYWGCVKLFHTWRLGYHSATPERHCCLSTTWEPKTCPRHLKSCHLTENYGGEADVGGSDSVSAGEAVDLHCPAWSWATSALS